MKRFTALLLMILTIIGTVAGCSSNQATDSSKDIKVITTIFPIYDWVRNIAGDDECVDTTLLLDNGVDLHSFQPTAEDILKISTCDMMIYVGGESDEWVSDAIKEASNKDMVVINLLDILGENAKEEETVEGMEAEEEEEETAYDEHVWLSLKNAEKFCNAIADGFSKIDSKHKDRYSKNAADYSKELEKLDGEYHKAVESAKADTLVFADRFPFRYLVDDYGLKYYAAFAGCSSESEASFETISFLASKVDELKLNTIMQIETSDGSIAKTVQKATKEKNQKILTLNSIQSTTSKDIELGTSYLSIMKENLKLLEEALG